MALGTCYSSIKYLMFTFNSIFFFLGLAVLGLGIWAWMDEDAAEVIDGSSENFQPGPVGFIIIGSITVLISLFGCLGSVCENQSMLATFFLLMFIIFVTLLSFAIKITLTIEDSLKNQIKERLETGVKKYKVDKGQRKYMDKVQTDLKCCGYETGEGDYFLDREGSLDGEGPPESCKTSATSRNTPCTDPLYEMAENNLIRSAGIYIGEAVVMIIGMIFSIVLICAIRNDKLHEIEEPTPEIDQLQQRNSTRPDTRKSAQSVDTRKSAQSVR